MIKYKCKCGNYTSIGSMSPPQCLFCDECYTALNCYNDYFIAKPHKFYSKKVETNDGDANLDICFYCSKSKRQLEKEILGIEENKCYRETKKSKKIMNIIKDYPIRPSFVDRILIVREGNIPSGSGDEFADKMTNLIKFMGIGLKYIGFDDEYYNFKLGLYEEI